MTDAVGETLVQRAREAASRGDWEAAFELYRDGLAGPSDLPVLGEVARRARTSGWMSAGSTLQGTAGAEASASRGAPVVTSVTADPTRKGAPVGALSVRSSDVATASWQLIPERCVRGGPGVLAAAEVPGVNVELSPLLLKDAAYCWRPGSPSDSCRSTRSPRSANCPVPPLGTLPNADAFSSAAPSSAARAWPCAASCWRRLWSSASRRARSRSSNLASTLRAPDGCRYR
jgi:hypothetical protein